MVEKITDIKSINMESDEGHKQRKNSNLIPILRDFFQSLGVRCNPEVVNGFNRQLLVFNFYFLPIVSFMLYLILLIG
jgi:hypothetical protein